MHEINPGMTFTISRKRNAIRFTYELTSYRHMVMQYSRIIIAFRAPDSVQP